MCSGPSCAPPCALQFHRPRRPVRRWRRGGPGRHARPRGSSGTDRQHPNHRRPDTARRSPTDPETATHEQRRRSAHDPAAGPQGPPGQGRQEQDPGPEGQPSAPWRVRARLHHHAEEAELGVAEGCPGPADEPDRGHRLHPGSRPQPAGALDGARAWRPRERPPRCPLQDRAWFARHAGREEPQAGAQPVRREEGEELMPRKGPAPKRPVVVDPVYNAPLVTQLVNKVLTDGKKSVAESIVHGALEGCRDKTGTDPVVTLKRALDNVKPTLEVRARRVGGATYQVPVEVRASRSTTLALRWLVGYSRDRREKTMTERLMNEILDASNGLGAAVKRREDMHKMAESNKAFAHYRW